jgi:hypothetical protein
MLRVGAGAVLLALVLTAPGHAQTEAAPDSANATAYSAEQLDQMVAPIALYPDDLLGQILMASTYPLEVVQADRWLQNPANASLRGDQLVQALQPMPWDASVKSLVAYPQILSMLDNNLDWMEQLGEAFLAQQGDVMDSVQRLRSRAQAAGTLAPTPQQMVQNNDQAIEIAPADSGTVYVPVYSPQVAYGAWPYPDYPPYDFYVPGYALGSYIAFPILVPYWGWDHWHWRHHEIDVDDGAGTPRFRPSPVRRGPWRHHPGHRGGVPYRDPTVRSRFEGGGDVHSAQGDFRGYSPAPGRSAPSNRPEVQPGRPALPPRRPEVQPVAPAPPIARAPIPITRPAMPRPEAPRAAPPMVQSRPPPALESFGRGAQVHTQEQRGVSSRMSAPAAGTGAHR